MSRIRHTAATIVVALLAALAWSVAPAEGAATTATSESQATLRPGQTLTSPDGRHRLVHQHDGNVVFYGPNGGIWQTKTVGRDTDTLVFQPDGNLVLYGEGQALWHSGTHDKGEALAVQDDANVVVYAPDKPVWAVRGMEPPARFRSNGSPDQNRHLGLLIAQERGWSRAMFDCANAIFNQESGWNHLIYNRAGSGAYGIPQALPGSKMSSHGADWKTNPETQIRWGYDYMVGRYGGPCQAHSFKVRNGWY